MFSVLVVVFAFFSLWLICSPDSSLYVPFTSIFKKISAALVLLSFFVSIGMGKMKIDTKSILLCLFPFFYYIFSLFDNYKDSGVISILVIAIIALFILSDKLTKVQVFGLFRAVLSVISILGIICYLAHFLGLSLPHYRADYYDNDRYYYIYYYFSVLVECGDLVRLCGLFNEPGYFGTILALVLCINNDNGNVKVDRYSILFFIAGVLTFSMAFFVTIGIYYLLQKTNKPSSWIIIIFFVAFFLFVLPNIHTGSDNLDMFIQRFSFGEEGFAGDNRSNLSLDLILLDTLLNGHALFGQGMGYTGSLELNVSSYKCVIIDLGLVGFILLYVLFFMTMLIRYRKISNTYPFIIVFFLNVYQRPYIYTIIYFIVLFGGLCAIEQNNKLSKQYQQIR